MKWFLLVILLFPSVGAAIEPPSPPPPQEESIKDEPWKKIEIPPPLQNSSKSPDEIRKILFEGRLQDLEKEERSDLIHWIWDEYDAQNHKWNIPLHIKFIIILLIGGTIFILIIIPLVRESSCSIEQRYNRWQIQFNSKCNQVISDTTKWLDEQRQILGGYKDEDILAFSKSYQEEQEKDKMIRDSVRIESRKHPLTGVKMTEPQMVKLREILVGGKFTYFTGWSTYTYVKATADGYVRNEDDAFYLDLDKYVIPIYE